jgi:3-deoxy-D-arabino-heptulosonate 7-phosphate (DAHP) synthase
VPVNVHIAKEYAFDVDVETTPTTGQPVPFHDDSIINKLFASAEKSASIIEFNTMVKKYDAEVFKGGSLIRRLSPSDFHGFELRSLTGQTCGSEEYVNNPVV